MTYSTLKLCSGGAGFEAIPSPKLHLDLARVRVALESRGIKVVDARVMLMVESQPPVTVSRDGRILVKTKEKAEAERALNELLPVFEPAPPRDAGRTDPEPTPGETG